MSESIGSVEDNRTIAHQSPMHPTLQRRGTATWLCSKRIDQDEKWLSEWASSVATAMMRAQTDVR
jgi:hypothetical protein